MGRRVWLGAVGGVAATHVVGCAATSPSSPKSPDRAAGWDPEDAGTPTSDPTSAKQEPAKPNLPTELALPTRPAAAEKASAFVKRVDGFGRGALDDAVFEAFASGNVPTYQRKLIPILLKGESGVTAEIRVTCDYISIGSDDDFIRMPVTAAGAQRMAELVDASLPTKHIVDVIYDRATGRIPPSWIDGGPSRDESLKDYIEHNGRLERKRKKAGIALGVLTAGHKKDIVLSTRLAENRGRVCIYGWQKVETGEVIQPLSTRHFIRYADYSHGVRLVAQAVQIDGRVLRFSDLLQDASLAGLFSDEGPLTVTAYPNKLPDPAAPWLPPAKASESSSTGKPSI